MHEAPEETGGRAGGWLRWTQILSNVAVILSALVIVPLYLLEREDSSQLERQQFAAELFMRKYDDRMLAAFAKVSDAYDSRNALFPIFGGAQEEGKKELSDSILADAGIDNVKIIVDYFDDILVCVDQGLCDARLTRSLIGPDIRIFFCKARHVGLPQLREKYAYADYGRRLETFAGDCAADQPAR